MWRKRSHYTRGRSGLCNRFDEAEAAVLRGAVKVIGVALCIAASVTSAGAAPTVRCGLADLSKLTRKVYVQTGGTDVNGCGTSVSNACKTVQQGIRECDGVGCGVLVRYGKYELPATIELVGGVSLYGSCEFEVDASSPLTRYRSVILAPPDGKPAISATGITTTTVLHGFNVLGSDARTPGAPSIVMLVKDSKGSTPADKLFLQFNQFVGGSGAAGADRQSPGRSPTAQSGSAGVTSWRGRPDPNSRKYCTAVDRDCANSSHSPGGRSASGQANGGNGGFMLLRWTSTYSYNCDWTDSGGQAGQGEHGGAGGIGASYPGAKCAFKYTPANGGTGETPTAAGSCAGQGGKASPDYAGLFDPQSSTWTPTQGGQGENGGSGSGGGGGGGGGSCIATGGGATDPYVWFAQGGGGGAGGQGGRGGPGGQQGGASFPLFLIRSPLAAYSNTFIPGPGGNGGKGGDGGLGGYGGGGGKGGQGGFDTVDGYACPGTGGNGGGGSQGGAGAGGAGGNGGPSVTVAWVGNEPQTGDGNRYYKSRPGAGGRGGAGGQEGAKGCPAAGGADGTTPPPEQGHHFGQ